MDPEQTSSEPSQLDKEIASLRKQAASLRKALRIQCSTILSSASTSRLIRSSSSPAVGRRPGSSETASSKLSSRSTQQQAHMQQCVYRISAPVTSFKVRDPDPNAVDDGHVLGLRFEIMSRGQFLRPYYVMLNRPYPGSRHLRVHRHTVPPAVPLAGLAARHLPQPSRAGGGSSSTDQDLDKFVRTLRTRDCTVPQSTGRVGGSPPTVGIARERWTGGSAQCARGSGHRRHRGQANKSHLGKRQDWQTYHGR
ncbi:hypothetical protein J3458_009271 [Metarhizium acridum]|uniref:uncharacterized protein n=1 Tax=Metarhizium acridum TaxID=92637 RepID=UPI001C6BB91E|nr:hypothetical protein J3458_009271 [Metarhizium acridum]